MKRIKIATDSLNATRTSALQYLENVSFIAASDKTGTQHFGHASLCGKVLYGVHRIGGFGIEQHLYYPDRCRCHFAFVLTIDMPVILRGHAAHDLIRQSYYEDC